MASTSNNSATAGAGAVYGLGLLGAVVYFWQTSDGFLDHIVGLLQALVWPAFLVYDVLRAVGTG